jgi:hypothetical protein
MQMQIFGLGPAEFGLIGGALFLIWLYPYSIQKVILMTERTNHKWLWIGLVIVLPILGLWAVDKLFSQKNNNYL